MLHAIIGLLSGLVESFACRRAGRVCDEDGDTDGARLPLAMEPILCLRQPRRVRRQLREDTFTRCTQINAERRCGDRDERHPH